MKRTLALLLLVMLVALGAACAQAPEVDAPTPTPTPTATPTPTPPPTPTPIAGIPATITDDLGRTVDVKSVPQRIVSLAPSNTEILFALGLGDKVVGVTDYCDYPQEAKEKTSVGSPYPGFSLETIVALEPDLVLGFGYTLPDYVPQLEALGLTVIVLAPKDIEDILADIELVGRITATEGKARKLTSDMRERIEAIVARTKDVSRPGVFWEFDATDPTKPWTAGPGSYNDALIHLAGGENIGAGGASSAFQMSAEAIIAADPEIILLGDFEFGVKVEDVAKRAGWSGIAAVKNNRVYPIKDSNLTDRPGPRIVDGLEMLARMIHPELFD